MPVYYGTGMCYDVCHGEHVQSRGWHERVFLPFYRAGSGDGIQTFRFYSTDTSEQSLWPTGFH